MVYIFTCGNICIANFNIRDITEDVEILWQFLRFKNIINMPLWGQEYEQTS